MALCSTPDFLIVIGVQSLQLPLLCRGGAKCIVPSVLLHLAKRKVGFRVLVANRDVHLWTLSRLFVRWPIRNKSVTSVVLCRQLERLDAAACRCHGSSGASSTRFLLFLRLLDISHLSSNFSFMTRGLVTLVSLLCCWCGCVWCARSDFGRGDGLFYTFFGLLFLFLLFLFHIPWHPIVRQLVFVLLLSPPWRRLHHGLPSDTLPTT
mmetsp:Transcript_33269/g.60984  ORF Transcript_33269/g.60984 Transcript_33269/m.60984 type:complete len:207 (-) Transcript_33269:30-650(-)